MIATDGALTMIASRDAKSLPQRVSTLNTFRINPTISLLGWIKVTGLGGKVNSNPFPFTPEPKSIVSTFLYNFGF
jgi:hypothetical protein